MGLLSCCYIYCPKTERVNQKNKSERKHKNNGVGVGNEENKKEKKDSLYQMKFSGIYLT